MFSSLPFSTDTFSSLGINLVEGVSLLDAIAVIEAKDGTLTLGGASAELSAIVDILANATVRTNDAKIFIWTAPSRSTTWIIPVDVGASTWTIPAKVGTSTWVLPS